MYVLKVIPIDLIIIWFVFFLNVSADWQTDGQTDGRTGIYSVEAKLTYDINIELIKLLKKSLEN